MGYSPYYPCRPFTEAVSIGHSRWTVYGDSHQTTNWPSTHSEGWLGYDGCTIEALPVCKPMRESIAIYS